jgi:hypothetical protein
MSAKQKVTLLMASAFFYSSAFATDNALPSMSDKQTQQLKAQLAQKTKNKQLKRLVADANPTIEKVLGMTACFTPRTAFGMYQSDQEGPGAITDQWLFSHHDKSQCVNVQRILDWKMTAKNALAFHVMFVSEQSGESLKKSYEIQKQLDGSWLFKQTYY